MHLIWIAVNTQEERQDHFQIEETMVPWLGRTAKCMMFFMWQRFDEVGVNITPKQWITLKFLIEEDGLDQKRLALITDRDKTSLTRLVTGMEKRGLVRREPSSIDKRVNRLFITDRGRNLFHDLMPVVNACIGDMQSGIDQDDINTVIRVSKQIQENITNQRSDRCGK